MPSGLLTVALGLAVQVGYPGPSEMPGAPALSSAYNQYGHEGQFEQRWPIDTQQNWVHGYFQEIPAYGGHTFFRPYNYKDVLSQSQTAAGWGLSPVMPYSQQFWHRYHDQATMLKLSQRAPGMTPQPQPQPYMLPQQQLFMPQQQMVMPAAAWTGQPTFTAPSYPAPAYAPVQGYVPVQGYAPAGPAFTVPVDPATLPR